MTALKIAVIGPKSTGKTTLIHTFLLNTFGEDAKLIQPSIHPIIYRESTTTVNEEYILKKAENYNNHVKHTEIKMCIPMTFDVKPMQSFMRKSNHVNIELYDIPSVNGDSKKLVDDYLKKSLNSFDLIICVFDINSELNEQVELDTLTLLSSSCDTNIIFILNKCDSMIVDDYGSPLFIRNESYERKYNQVCKTIKSQFNKKNYQIACTSLNRIYIYLLKHLNSNFEPTMDSYLDQSMTSQNSGYNFLCKLISNELRSVMNYNGYVKIYMSELTTLATTDDFEAIDKWLDNTIRINNNIRYLQICFSRKINCELCSFVEENCIVIKEIFEREIKPYFINQRPIVFCENLTIQEIAKITEFNNICKKFVTQLGTTMTIYKINKQIDDMLLFGYDKEIE